MNAGRKLSRRGMLRFVAGVAGASALAACGAVTPQVVEKVVIVESTVVVEKEVAVTAAASAAEVRVAFYVMGESWMGNVDAIKATSRREPERQGQLGVAPGPGLLDEAADGVRRWHRP